MEPIQESILSTIAYFDIFSHPLTAEEIKSFMSLPCSTKDLSFSLNELLGDEIIYCYNDFYSLTEDKSLAEKRVKANKYATKQLKIVKRVAGFLSWFPYVKGVAVSGSLSKNIADKKSDIDFFIITKENRLWIAKIFFSVFVKLATFFGFGKWFCLNYTIDESYLEVEEKNVFTATEIVTLIPLRGNGCFKNFFIANEWVYDFFPGRQISENDAKELLPIMPRRIIEWLFKFTGAEKTDNAIMNYFNRRWKKLIAKKIFMKSGFQLGAMMVNKHYCRPYPQHFQKKILQMHKERIEKIKLKFPALELQRLIV